MKRNQNRWGSVLDKPQYYKPPTTLVSVVTAAIFQTSSSSGPSPEHCLNHAIVASSKLFYARLSSYSRSSTALVLCLLIGLSGLVFGFIAISRHVLGHDCKLGKPLSVSVRWEKTSAGSPDEGPKRHKVMGFVGIQTGFGSADRRGALRRTWFPSDHEGFKRLEESSGLAFRFVIGRSSDASKMSELKKEVVKYDDFLLLDIEEECSKLPYKTPTIFAPG